MLYYIVDPKINDTSFRTFVENIKDAYWPEVRYKNSKMVQLLPKWADPPPEHHIIKEIGKGLVLMVGEVCIGRPGLYTKTDGENGTRSENLDMRLPFMDWFHKLFLQRQYDYPYRDPQKHADDILSLEINSKINSTGKGNENYSKNFGNFNHFVNVVMATARIIRYFRNPAYINHLMDGNSASNAAHDLSTILSYRDTPSMRTFKLMLAAFYHDIGKTIVDHRHGMEGSFIIADHTTRSLAQLDAIVRQYNDEYSLEREDLIETSNLLYYHDSFGTFGTGESSYTLLTEIIDRIKRGSLKHLGKPKVQRDYCNRTLFDLWILNIADIVVSNKDKSKFQDLWLSDKDSAEAIKRFFETEGGKNRIHDLRVAMRLLQKHNEGTHKDDTLDLERMAQQESRSHTVERIKRLVWASLSVAIVQFVDEKKSVNNSQVKLKVLDGILKTNASPAEPKIVLLPGVIHNVVFRSIQSLNDSKEFYRRLAWIVSMDYALGFFTKIARRAIEAVDNELQTGKSVTGWIRSRNASASDPAKPSEEQVRKANAAFFIDNYCATVVKMLAHLLFRERSIDQPSSIEFEDARNRLIDEKIDKIIGMEGPYRQNKSIELILKSVFVY